MQRIKSLQWFQPGLKATVIKPLPEAIVEAAAGTWRSSRRSGLPTLERLWLRLRRDRFGLSPRQCCFQSWRVPAPPLPSRSEPLVSPGVDRLIRCDPPVAEASEKMRREGYSPTGETSRLGRQADRLRPYAGERFIGATAGFARSETPCWDRGMR